MLLRAKAFPEWPVVDRGIAEYQPENDRVFIRQNAFGHFPNLPADGTGFIKNDEDELALVMQASERFGIVLAPSLEVGAIVGAVLRVHNANAGGLHVPELAVIGSPVM